MKKKRVRDEKMEKEEALHKKERKDFSNGQQKFSSCGVFVCEIILFGLKIFTVFLSCCW